MVRDQNYSFFNHSSCHRELFCPLIMHIDIIKMYIQRPYKKTIRQAYRDDFWSHQNHVSSFSRDMINLANLLPRLNPECMSVCVHVCAGEKESEKERKSDKQKTVCICVYVSLCMCVYVCVLWRWWQREEDKKILCRNFAGCVMSMRD